MFAVLHVIELVHRLFDYFGLICEDARLDVSLAIGFHADSRTREVGGADIGSSAVENHCCEMYPRTEPPLQSAPQYRMLVEIRAEVFSRLFSVKQPHIDTPF